MSLGKAGQLQTVEVWDTGAACYEPIWGVFSSLHASSEQVCPHRKQKQSWPVSCFVFFECLFRFLHGLFLWIRNLCWHSWNFFIRTESRCGQLTWALKLKPYGTDDRTCWGAAVGNYFCHLAQFSPWSLTGAYSSPCLKWAWNFSQILLVFYWFHPQGGRKIFPSFWRKTFWSAASKMASNDHQLPGSILLCNPLPLNAGWNYWPIQRIRFSPLHLFSLVSPSVSWINWLGEANCHVVSNPLEKPTWCGKDLRPSAQQPVKMKPANTP